MEYIKYDENNNKASIKKMDAFCSLNNEVLPEESKSITSLLSEFDSVIKTAEPRITSGALANSHGDWYECLIAISALNYTIEKKTAYIALLLPNIARFDVADLYCSKIQNYIKDLRKKVKDASDVSLITSNPDLVLIDYKMVEGFVLPDKAIECVTPENIELLEELYKNFIGKCSFDSIIGYLSVKNTLRPDRRLQIAHEGSLMKAVYMHLQTRQWLLDPKGLKFYAVSTKIGEKDRLALKTVATHSIITVNTKPQAAVDEVFKVDNLAEADKMFQAILV